MKTKSPLNPAAFTPFFCPAHRAAVTSQQFIMQLQPPFQFIGLVTCSFTSPDNSFLHIEIVPKPGWPKQYSEIVEEMEAALLSNLRTLFPDIPETLDTQIRKTDITIEDLDPSIDFLYCESGNFGWPEDTLVHVHRPWKTFGIGEDQKVYLIYSESPQHHSIEPTQIATDPTLTKCSIIQAQEFYDTFMKQLDSAEPEDFLT